MRERDWMDEQADECADASVCDWMDEQADEWADEPVSG